METEIKWIKNHSVLSYSTHFIHTDTKLKTLQEQKPASHSKIVYNQRVDQWFPEPMPLCLSIIASAPQKGPVYSLGNTVR